MNPRQLLKLKEEANAAKAVWNTIDEKLRKACNHPSAWVDKKSTWHSDTLGNNGYEEYHYECSICSTYLDEKYYIPTGKENEG